ncbi:MAPEG family protein [Pseudomonas sp. RL]|uniref:MAPEG family protein n=1 Tax=Pseudomonas sp. RL TaxID=1452718 RepID=UPI000482F866|nr:MAPEG family protein [Pseudomonas sp. RL]
MNAALIFWPVLAQIALTLAIYIFLARRKAGAVKSRAVNMREAALDNRAWPESVVKVSNNLANQFESPVLFYALCLMLHAIDGVSLPALLLAWLYVALRVVHAGIHIGSNQLSRRMPVFVLGTGVLLALLGLSAWQLAAS